MEKAIRYAQVVRFATFELDLQAGEVRKAGLKLKLSGQPFQDDVLKKFDWLRRHGPKELILEEHQR